MNQSSILLSIVENVRLYRENRLRARKYAGSNLDLQVDALKAAGCERIYQDVAGERKLRALHLMKCSASCVARCPRDLEARPHGRSLTHLVDWWATC